MKHVFLIHSPITYIVAASIRSQLELKPDNVVYLCDGFTPPDMGVRIINLAGYYARSSKMGQIIAFFKYFNKAALIDRLILSTLDAAETFTAYIPVMRFVEKTIVTNPRCAAFHFMEEGLIHYVKTETLQTLTLDLTKENWRWNWKQAASWKTMFRYSIAAWRGYTLRLRSLPFAYSSYAHISGIRFYGITPGAFPMAPVENRVTISLTRIPSQSQYEHNLTDGLLWVGDNSVDYYGFSLQLYLHGLENGLIRYLVKHAISRIFVKFHRGESPLVRKAQQSLFEKNNIKVEYIPDHIVLEPILASAQNVTVFGVYSSLLFYTANMGHTTISIFELIEQEYGKAVAGRDMDYYWKNIKNIKSVI